MFDMKKTIKVVGAIIENENREILCALRSPRMSLPNTWEFPGGKMNPNETISQAIEREVKEELGCVVQFLEVFHKNIYEYDSFIVDLMIVRCQLVEGIPTANEHSKLLWLKRENLSSLHWPPANAPAVQQLMQEKV